MDPAVGAELEPCRVPRGVGVDRSRELAELDLPGHLVGVQVQGEGHLEQALAVAPLDVAADVEACRPGGELVGLLEPGRPFGPADPHPRHERAAVDERDLVGLEDRRRPADVEVLDVPGVVLDGKVRVELQHAGHLAGSHCFPAGRQVDERRDVAVAVDDDPDEAVVEDDAVGAVRGGHRSHTGREVGRGQGDAHRAGVHPLGRPAVGELLPLGVDHLCHCDAAVRDRRRVHVGDGVGPRAGDGPHRVADDLLELGLDPLVGLGGLSVDPADGRAGEDVVELVQEHVLPQRVQALHHLGSGGVGAVRGDHPGLGLAQPRLAAAVAGLSGGLRGERAAVHLEVELADPPRGVGVLLDRLVEETGRRLDLQLRRALEVLRPVVLAEHAGGGTAAAVAVAERQQ